MDGLIYKGLKYEELETSQYYNNLISKLSETAKNYNALILAISHENPVENYKLAKDLNWLYFFNPPSNNYLKFEDNIFDVNINSMSQ